MNTGTNEWSKDLVAKEVHLSLIPEPFLEHSQQGESEYKIPQRIGTTYHDPERLGT